VKHRVVKLINRLY